ncbi:hypothetical protein Pla52o_38400 [Novipirellula galeiformis]|uniref:Uncharacterized protein n=1 Tax=Novipirellula galeiformis TaxID=2528004 RepID=A0A5C6CAC1_9BACT|nr:hypothetical protein [Novipirellula galeiformis]TWU21653.1 hypothetical protein Pla52o_38400 [Novipirellula galeiformis]
MKTKLAKVIGILTFLVMVSSWGSPLFSQEPTTRIHVVGPDGKFAPDTIVHRFNAGELVFLPDGKAVISMNAEPVHRSVLGYVRLMDEGDGIQVEPPPSMSGMGMMMGMDSGSNEVGNPSENPTNILYSSPRALGVFFATNPKNEFAFVPPSTSVGKKIQLREPAKLTFSVPGHYTADRYVVLALWTNGFVYPQFAFKRAITSKGGQGGFAAGGPVGDETGPGTSDWRFNSYVSYWQVAPLTAPEKEDANGFLIASLTVPPGEVRVTLVPKERFEEVQHNAKLLNQLSLTGGPSRIVVARARPTTNTANNLPIALVADGTLDLEIQGDLTEAAMPDWSSDEQLVVLTRSDDAANTPNTVDSDDYVRLADSTRAQRSDYRPLGIVAHRSANGTYLATGLVPGKYQAWTVPKSKLERGTDFRRPILIDLVRIENISSTTAGILMRKVTAKIGSSVSSSSNTFVLPTTPQERVSQSVSDDPFADPGVHRVASANASEADKERRRRILMLAKQIQEMDQRIEVAKEMLTQLMRQEQILPTSPAQDPFAKGPFDPFGGGSGGVDPFHSPPSRQGKVNDDPFAP